MELIDYIIAALLLSSMLLFAAGRAGVRRAKRRAYWRNMTTINMSDDSYPTVYVGNERATFRSTQAGGINKHKFFGG